MKKNTHLSFQEFHQKWSSSCFFQNDTLGHFEILGIKNDNTAKICIRWKKKLFSQMLFCNLQVCPRKTCNTKKDAIHLSKIHCSSITSISVELFFHEIWLKIKQSNKNHTIRCFILWSEIRVLWHSINDLKDTAIHSFKILYCRKFVDL